MSFKVLIIDDQLNTAEAHKALILDIGFACEIEADPNIAIQKIRNDGGIDLLLLDINMPQMHNLELFNTIKAEFPNMGFIIATGINDVQHAIKAIKSGAFNYILKPLQKDRLKVVIENYIDSIPQNSIFEKAYSKYITQHIPFKTIFDSVSRLATEDVSVFISGEVGTGHELIANLLHANSIRKSEKFISLKVADFSDILFDSELFGHVAGAFRKADNEHVGLLERFDRITIFIDEVGELTLNNQNKILSILQDGSYCKLGESTERKTNAKFIFATSKDLKNEITEKNFSEFLFHKISTHKIHLPPLRERIGDIELLTNYFFKKYTSQYGRSINTIAKDTLDFLLKYEYPGNQKELEGIISSSVLLEQTSILTSDSIPSHIKVTYNVITEIDRIRARAISKVINEFGGNQTKAAVKLGLARGTLNRLIKKFKDMGYEI